MLHVTWRPARSWVQRAEVLGDSLVLFQSERKKETFSHGMHPFVCLKYFPSHTIQAVPIMRLCLCLTGARHSSVLDVWCENGAYKPLLFFPFFFSFFFALFLVPELFCVFLVSL